MKIRNAAAVMGAEAVGGDLIFVHLIHHPIVALGLMAVTGVSLIAANNFDHRLPKQ